MTNKEIGYHGTKHKLVIYFCQRREFGAALYLSKPSRSFKGVFIHAKLMLWEVVIDVSRSQLAVGQKRHTHG